MVLLALNTTTFSILALNPFGYPYEWVKNVEETSYFKVYEFYL